jgi:hypothetical protein
MPVVEPFDPFKRCELDFFDVSPWTIWVDGRGLEEPRDRMQIGNSSKVFANI